MNRKDLRLATVTILSGVLLTAALPGFADSPYSSYGQPSQNSDSNYNQSSQNSDSNYGQGNSNYGSNGPSYGQGYNQSYNQGGNGGGYNQSYGPLPPLQGRVATAPAGTQLEVTLSSPISSGNASVGDTVSTRLNSDLSIGGNLVLPAGSEIDGQITDVQKAGMLNKSGKISIHFTSALGPNGQRVPLSAMIATSDRTGVLSGGSLGSLAGKEVKDTAIGAATGALAGVIFSPLAGGGHMGRAAAIGTGIGGGAGLLGGLVTKGGDINIHSGTKLNIMLDQPLTVNTASQGSYY